MAKKNYAKAGNECGICNAFLTFYPRNSNLEKFVENSSLLYRPIIQSSNLIYFSFNSFSASWFFQWFFSCFFFIYFIFIFNFFILKSFIQNFNEFFFMFCVTKILWCFHGYITEIKRELKSLKQISDPYWHFLS